jgi:hypothetical protein
VERGNVNWEGANVWMANFVGCGRDAEQEDEKVSSLYLRQKVVDGRMAGFLFVRKNRFSNAICLFLGVMAFVDRPQ